MILCESKYAISYQQEMKKIFPASESDSLWKAAEEAFQKLLEENPDQPQAVAKHTQISIFPAIAVYQTIAAKYPDQAMQVLENGAGTVSKKAGESYARLLKFPGIKLIFLKVFSKGVKKGFGPDAGFAHEFITNSDKTLEFHVTKCPYQHFCEKYDCPEIVHIFCKNDEYAYGNLPHIRFIRTQTLGTGGNCCDFKFMR